MCSARWPRVCEVNSFAVNAEGRMDAEFNDNEVVPALAADRIGFAKTVQGWHLTGLI